MLLYPEFGETDFVEEWREEEQFQQHLEAMLGPEVERPGWDPAGRFTPSTVRLFFEDPAADQLVRVPAAASLASQVARPGYTLRGGTPAFIVLTAGGKFTQDFLSKYTVVD
jgi:hypothetical protein